MPFANINDVKIHFNTVGNGKPLLFIAGLGVDNRTWMFQIPTLQKYFTVIVFDNRGIGKSASSVSPYTIKLMADDVAQLLKHLGINAAHMVGSSMGGMVSQEFAINYPGMVDKLVLCSTSAKPRDTVKDALSEGFKDILDKNIEDILQLKHRRPLIEKVFNYLVQQLYSDKFIRENKKLIESTVQEFTSDISYLETFIKQTRAIRLHDTVDKLHLIRAETLVITGTNDKLIPVEASELLVEKIPKAKLVKVEGASHGFHLEQAEFFNKVLLDFLLEN
ncbi:MAG: alpha/beta hydrolase [Candidatus Thermoplasmatota archaeon]|nr:alpha/beta hydrolase [Candidatus Thermoplasmatota archaeon]